MYAFQFSIFGGVTQYTCTLCSAIEALAVTFIKLSQAVSQLRLCAGQHHIDRCHLPRPLRIQHRLRDALRGFLSCAERF